MGSHAWPEQMVKDEKVEAILADLKQIDESAPDLGLRAFVWNVENYY